MHRYGYQNSRDPFQGITWFCLLEICCDNILRVAFDTVECVLLCCSHNQSNLKGASMERSSATQRSAAVADSSRPSSPPDKDNPVKPTVRSQEGSVVVTSAAATRGSCGGPASSQQKVKEAVAIAAGKKGMGQSDDDEPGKPAKSNMLCYLYWLLVLLILGLISFTVWLSIQLARRHSVAMMAESTLPVLIIIIINIITLSSSVIS